VSAPVQAQPFLAADVGGTHARIALVVAGADAAPQVLAHASYRCAGYPDLAAIVAAFMAGLDVPVQVAVVASAGSVQADGSLISANLPWPLCPLRLREALGLEAGHLINDCQALARAVRHLARSALPRLAGPAQPGPGPLLVLGPGTGLGAALWIPTRHGGVVLPTEAGQAALAVRTPLELELLRQLQASGDHVSIEHALSGPGLLQLYRALCALRGVAAVHAQPAAVSAAALQGDDPLAGTTLEVFCGLLGSTAGDLALMYGAQGVYLAGGILPQVAPLLAASDFGRRFVDKGPMRAALEQVSVRLVEHGQLGVTGAASWYLEQASA